jgi:RNA polymerase sigma factor (sigma-70 family)
MLSSQEDAEDVLQEVFTASFNAICADERPINARPWLYRIARNRCLNHLRRPQPAGQDSMDVFERDGGASTADTVHKRQEFLHLVSDVQDLPETQRTALLLREIDALSYDQIAEAMDTTVPSVKSLLVRARVSLAEAAEARLLTCDEVRLELGQVAEGLAKTSAPARRHLRSCERCRTFRSELRKTTKALAAVYPIGPLVFLKKLSLAKLGIGGAASGAAASGGAATGGAGIAGTAATAAGGITAGGAVSAGVGTIATKAAAGVAAAAIVTAGAVEVRHAAVTQPAVQPTPIARAAPKVAPRPAPAPVHATKVAAKPAEARPAAPKPETKPNPTVLPTAAKPAEATPPVVPQVVKPPAVEEDHSTVTLPPTSGEQQSEPDPPPGQQAPQSTEPAPPPPPSSEPSDTTEPNPSPSPPPGG